MKYYIEIDGYALESRTSADDLSQEFTATCSDTKESWFTFVSVLPTGEILRIRGDRD